jgi:FkbM family methyltransferase
MTIPNIIVNSVHGPMIVNENDQYIGQSIRQLGAWAQDDIDLIASFCDLILENKPKMVLYDVGANIGTHSIALAKKYGNRISIRSFEAQRQVYYMLCGNVAINGLTNVECVHAAVCDDADNTIKIDLPDYHLPNNFGGLELIAPCISDNQYMTKTGSELVNCTTIDHFDEPVDFIKMDIEGMEHLALAGGIDTLAKHRPVCFLEMYKTDTDRVKQIFKKLDYVVYTHTHDNWIFLPAETNVSIHNANKVEL